jgi:hypothetical protein
MIPITYIKTDTFNLTVGPTLESIVQKARTRGSDLRLKSIGSEGTYILHHTFVTRLKSGCTAQQQEIGCGIVLIEPNVIHASGRRRPIVGIGKAYRMRTMTPVNALRHHTPRAAGSQYEHASRIAPSPDTPPTKARCCRSCGTLLAQSCLAHTAPSSIRLSPKAIARGHERVDSSAPNHERKTATIEHNKRRGPGQ